MSAFLLCILLASWRAAQEEAVGAGVGRTAVTSGPAALKGTTLQAACGKRVSKTFKHPELSKPKANISQLN